MVGEAESGLEAVSKARTLNPDVVLMDIRMPGMNGLDATAKLAGPGVGDPIAVVVVTTFDHDVARLTGVDYGGVRATDLAFSSDGGVR